MKINDRSLQTLRIGEVSPEGVKLLDVRDGIATLEVDGRAINMRIGQSTMTQTVLTADAQGHFVTTARINGMWPAYEAALKSAGASHEAYTYAGTQHGFHNNSTPRYNEAAAKLSWERTVAHFKKHLA